MRMEITMAIQHIVLFLIGIGLVSCWMEEALALQPMQDRRGFLTRGVVAAPAVAVGMGCALVASTTTTKANAATGNLVFYSSSSLGKQFQYADAKIGLGDPKQIGDPVIINYIMSSPSLSNGVKITESGQVPYQWVLGDRSTIPGLEQAVTGGDGVPAMLPGGIRRVIMQGGSAGGGYDTKDCSEGIGKGPVPRDTSAYNRFKNTFCNPTRPDTPELVLDIKLLLPAQISTYVLDND